MPNSPPDCWIKLFEPLGRKEKRPHFRVVFGAGDEARTRYLHLGKVALYRMSYTRRNKRYYNSFSENVNTFFPIFQNILSYKESLVWRRKPSPKT